MEGQTGPAAEEAGYHMLALAELATAKAPTKDEGKKTRKAWMTWTDDMRQAAADFAKAHDKFVILGGAMGKTALDSNGVKALAALPSLDQLRARLIGLIQAPATKIAQVINAPAAKVARVVAAYANKGEAA